VNAKIRVRGGISRVELSKILRTAPERCLARYIAGSEQLKEEEFKELANATLEQIRD
jgi:hypothetical protein